MTDLTLYRIEEDLQALLDSVETCPDELRPEIEQRIAEYVTAEVDKIDRVGAVLSSLEAVQVHAKAEIERLRDRQQAAERDARRLEQYLLQVLRQRGGQALKGRSTTFIMRKTEALTIIAPELVPDRFKRTTVNVDIPKTPIKEALKS